ncbi:MAG TPA: hypothetical protein VFZ61_34220 [Polyangiales bacterium]
MQRSALLTVSLLTTAVLFSGGCSDLGECDDPAEGRTLAERSKKLTYVGQAIITQSCAGGSCHTSGATGTVRQGAPADLNFDLNPLEPGAPITDAQGKVLAVQVDPDKRAQLRRNQQIVYDNREAIWDQVKQGLMPPSNFPTFKGLAGIFLTKITGQGMCTAGAQLTNLDADKEKLRQWLACESPVVETSSPDLPYQAPPATASEADQAAGSVYYVLDTKVGYQYPSCNTGSMPGDGGAPDAGDGGGSAKTFSELYTGVLATCSGCHPAVNGALDFSTEDKAYASLLGANGMGKPQMMMCAGNPAPYVTPGNPAMSYLLPKMDNTNMSGTKCGDLMPLPNGLNAAELAEVRAWIMAGAKR